MLVVLESIEVVLILPVKPGWKRKLNLNLHDQIEICASIEEKLLSEGCRRLWGFDINFCRTPAEIYAAYAGIMRLNQNYNPLSCLPDQP